MKKLTAVSALTGFSLITAQATLFVFSDPALQTDSSKIYASTRISVADGATAIATLRAQADFGSVYDWRGTTWPTASQGLGTDNQGILSFADVSRPDVMLSFSGSAASTAGTTILNSSFESSGDGSSLRIVSNSASEVVSMTAIINFGSWNGTLFDDSVNAVSAAGFTLTTTGRWDSVSSLSVSFKDAEGKVLATQTVPDGFPSVDTSASLYFGYKGDGDLISSIEISMSGTSHALLGLDELGFTPAVPEPGAVALWIGLAVLPLAVFRRRLKR